MNNLPMQSKEQKKQWCQRCSKISSKSGIFLMKICRNLDHQGMCEYFLLTWTGTIFLLKTQKNTGKAFYDTDNELLSTHSRSSSYWLEVHFNAPVRLHMQPLKGALPSTAAMSSYGSHNRKIKTCKTLCKSTTKQSYDAIKKVNRIAV